LDFSSNIKGDIDYIIEKLEDLNLPLLAKIPEDDIITKYELKRKPIIEIPENSRSFLVINKIIDDLFLFTH